MIDFREFPLTLCQTRQYNCDTSKSRSRKEVPPPIWPGSHPPRRLRLGLYAFARSLALARTTDSPPRVRLSTDAPRLFVPIVVPRARIPPRKFTDSPFHGVGHGNQCRIGGASEMPSIDRTPKCRPTQADLRAQIPMVLERARSARCEVERLLVLLEQSLDANR